MKIDMVSAYACRNPDGRSSHVAELSIALSQAGHDVTVYAQGDTSWQSAEPRRQNGYRLVEVPVGPARPVPADHLLPYVGSFGSFLRDRWMEGRPDVVHAHFWLPGLAATLAARACDVPVVQTFHSLSEGSKPTEHARIEQLVAKHADRVITTCSQESSMLIRRGVPRNRISVIPGGVDLSRFSPEGCRIRRSRLHRIVCAGQLLRRKGFDLAIAALAHLADTELLVAAEHSPQHPEAARLDQLAARLAVGDRVRWLGRVSRADMPALFRSADAVLCTPRYEPFGKVALEAMACGVPVVAAAVGGLADIVVDGVTGVLVPLRARNELASRLRPLLDDPVLRETYGAAGRDRARARYSWGQVSADTLHVYKNIQAV